jgi:hypothetical protein
MKTNQRYKIGTDTPYEIDNIEIDTSSEISLFDSETGEGGIGYIPADGDTVYVSSGVLNSDSDVKDLTPSLNNNLYYLVSDQLYDETQKDTIISLATVISLTLTTYLQDDVLDNLLDDVDDELVGTSVGAASNSRYVGSFVFSNPTDMPYLYLVWDHTDNMGAGTASYTGDAATKYIDIDFGSDIGNTGIDYNITGLTAPSRFTMEWNGNVLADTGYVGLNSQANYDNLIAAGVDTSDINLTAPYDGLVDNGVGSILFNKFSSESSAVLTVYSPLDTNIWDLTQVAVTLTSFYLDSAEGTLANVCSQVADGLFYHDGSGLVPVIGDRIYSAADGSATFDGTNTYHLISDVLQVVPPVSGGLFVGVDVNGLCYTSGECDCAEIAVPTVTQSAIEIVQGKSVNLRFEASNNPTSWTVTTACNEYTLNGGTNGSIFSITTCAGVVKNVTINIQTDTPVYSTTLPTLSFGDGTITLVGPYIQSVLPQGLNFNSSSGILSGTPSEACEYTINVTATNCFGDSLDVDVNISVDSGIQLTPFAIDVENSSADGTTACAITAVYSLLYHNGIAALPTLNDKIFTDWKATELFMGGSRWYNIDGSTESVKICETGKICDVHTC